MKRTGILLMNLGGPTTLKEVRPFLFNLFSDPDILVGVPWGVRQVLAGTIATLKGKSSIEAYAKIGGGSPQLKWTTIQSRALQDRLNASGLNAVIEIGMRAWKPSIETGLKKLRSQSVDRLILLPMFPHYSATTTGSCLKEVQRLLAKMKWSIDTFEICRWPNNPHYVELIRQTLDEQLLNLSKSELQTTHILFSAHSLPMKVIDRGDPYASDVFATVEKLSVDLPAPSSLAFQSRNGPIPWLKPYVETEIPRLAKSGIKTLLMVPVSFVSDHIETLFELDMLYKDEAEKHGISKFLRTRAFNDDPKFIDTLFSLCEPHLA